MSASTLTISHAACLACTASRKSSLRRLLFQQHGSDRTLSRRGTPRKQITHLNASWKKPHCASIRCGCAKNLIPPSAMPSRRKINTYDSGKLAIVNRRISENSANSNKSAKREKEPHRGSHACLSTSAMPMEQASFLFFPRRATRSRLQCTINRAGPCHRFSASACRQARN